MPENAHPDDWLSLSKENHKDVFSEIDVLLRALDGFFAIEHLPPLQGDPPNRNFSEELTAVRDVINRVLALLEVVIPERKRNVYWFQKFAAAKYLKEKRRDAFREDLYRQDTPEKSLLLLYDSLVNLKGVAADILKTEYISFLTFMNIGQLIGRDLRENVHFSPFRKEPDSEYDAIRNQEVSAVVRSIREKETRKVVSVLLLYLFRFLRYLDYVNNSNTFGSLNPSLLIILLLRSEISRFRALIESVSGGVADEALRSLIKSLSYQFSIETKRVFDQELREPAAGKSHQRLKGRVENSHGILRNLTEQGIIQIVRFFRPETEGNEIFESFITKVEQSLRLREDLLILHRFLSLLEESKKGQDRSRIFIAMRNFMLYFQSFTFKLLRHDDYEEFGAFFDRILTLGIDRDPENLDRITDSLRHFRIFTETCLRQLSNRAELIERPVDPGKVEASVWQYLH